MRPLHPLRPRGRLRPQCQHRRLSRRQRGHAEAVQGGGRQRGYVAGAAQDPQVGGLGFFGFTFWLKVKYLCKFTQPRYQTHALSGIVYTGLGIS